MATASESVVASGFSQNTDVPARTAASTNGRCSEVQVQMYTASHEANTSSTVSITV